MNKIFITGAAGFIGSHLQKELQSYVEVSGMDNLQAAASRQRSVHFGASDEHSIHSGFIDQMHTKPDVLIHLAAETGISGSLNNPARYFHQNVEGTFNVLEQCRKNGVNYLIYASSSSVYEPNQSIMHEDSPHDKQLSFYGTSKRMTELMIDNYCRQFGITAIGLRFFTVYGSWTRTDMAAYKFMKAISNGNPVTLYNEGNVFRDFTHVSDIVTSIRLLVNKIVGERPGTHQIFNIGNGAPVSVHRYAELIAHYLEKPLQIQYATLPPNELKSTHSDTSKLESYTGYKPICSIEQGIHEMTTWFKNDPYEK